MKKTRYKPFENEEGDLSFENSFKQLERKLIDLLIFNSDPKRTNNEISKSIFYNNYRNFLQQMFKSTFHQKTTF